MFFVNKHADDGWMLGEQKDELVGRWMYEVEIGCSVDTVNIINM